MAFVAPVLPFIMAHAGTIATVASAASAGLGAVSAIRGAQSEANMIEANADLMEQTARERRVASSVEAERVRRANRVANARDRAGTAQAGALSGTSLDLLNQNSVARELDALTVEYNGTQAARGMENQAQLDRSEASGVRNAGYWDAAGSVLRGAASFDPLNYSPTRPSGSVPVY